MPTSHVVTVPTPSSNDDSSPDLKIIVIHIHRLPNPIEVSYAYVDDHVPEAIFHKSSGNSSSADNGGESSNSTSTTPIYDMTLNIGLAAGNSAYALETRARRDGYTQRDIYGKTPATLVPQSQTKAPAPKLDEARAVGATAELSVPEADPTTPTVLTPTFDVHAVFRQWESRVRRAFPNAAPAATAPASAPTKVPSAEHQKDQAGDEQPLTPQSSSPYGPVTVPQPFPQPKVHLSQDAGRYLCEYTFYACLAEWWRWSRQTDADADIREGAEIVGPVAISSLNDDQGSSSSSSWRKRGERPCFFMHVPQGTETEDVDRGVTVTLALLEAIVSCDT